MSITFRVVLIVASIIVCFYILRKIRKSQLNVDDAFFWIICAGLLVLLSIIPEIASFFAVLLGIQSPSNFVFLVMISIIMYKLFTASVELSVQKRRLNSLIQRLAIMNYEKKREDIDLIKSEIIDFNEKEAVSKDNETK